MIFTGHIPLHPHTPTYVTLRHQAGCVEVEFVFEEKQDTSTSPYNETSIYVFLQTLKCSPDPSCTSKCVLSPRKPPTKLSITHTSLFVTSSRLCNKIGSSVPRSYHFFDNQSCITNAQSNFDGCTIYGKNGLIVSISISFQNFWICFAFCSQNRCKS